MKWYTGSVDPWWDSSFKDLDYIYLPLKNTHDLERWTQEGYADHLNLNGALYNMDRPMPAYAQGFLDLFPWQDVGIAFYRMNCCDALPLHKDAYTTYKKIFGLDNKQIWRAIVFLEDWKTGHYLEVDGRPLMPWNAGDWVAWNDDVPHYAGNFGLDPRYTMQITGHV